MVHMQLSMYTSIVWCERLTVFMLKQSNRGRAICSGHSTYRLGTMHASSHEANQITLVAAQ
jgi:hypothetical protein